MVFPELVEDLYEDDYEEYDGESICSCIQDIELEENTHSWQKQRDHS